MYVLENAKPGTATKLPESFTKEEQIRYQRRIVKKLARDREAHFRQFYADNIDHRNVFSTLFFELSLLKEAVQGSGSSNILFPVVEHENKLHIPEHSVGPYTELFAELTTSLTFTQEFIDFASRQPFAFPLVDHFKATPFFQLHKAHAMTINALAALEFTDRNRKPLTKLEKSLSKIWEYLAENLKGKSSASERYASFHAEQASNLHELIQSCFNTERVALSNPMTQALSETLSPDKIDETELLAALTVFYTYEYEQLTKQNS